MYKNIFSFILYYIFIRSKFISIVNYHNVNKILFSFLTLWRENPVDDTIPLSVFVGYFDDKYHNLIEQFFQHCIKLRRNI